MVITAKRETGWGDFRMPPREFMFWNTELVKLLAGTRITQPE